MSASSLIMELAHAGVVLWLDQGKLRFRARPGIVDASRRRRVGDARRGLVALLELGAMLPQDVRDWPEEARANLEERASIMELEGGLSRGVADRSAEQCVREEHVRQWLAAAAMD